MIKRVELAWAGAEQFALPTRDGVVEVTADGVVQLVKRVTVADEIGAVTGRDVQPVYGLVWARKDLVLDSAEASAARLSVWARSAHKDATLILEVNGHVIQRPPCEDPAGRWDASSGEHPYWRYAWQPVKVPTEWLRAGTNTVIVRSEDGGEWELLIEDARQPNRSAVSVDGGVTWDYAHLGYNDCYDGELLVRLELERYPCTGRITSEVFDLAAAASGDGIGAPVTLQRLCLDLVGTTPRGTMLGGELRAGPTPQYDPATWSAWQRAEGMRQACCGVRASDRFAQWRVTLSTTRPLDTPRLRGVRVTGEVAIEDGNHSWGILRAEDNPMLVYPSAPVGRQLPSRRTRMLRERWRLDEVVRGAQDDWERIVRLATWTRDQWSDGWNRYWKQLHVCPPWDAPLILELTRHNLSLGMCTHYSTVFVHVCAAMGIPARHVIHHSHCTAEAWCDRWGKWAWLDFSGDMSDGTRAIYYVTRDGVPQSALEVRRAWQRQDYAGMALQGRHAELVFDLQERAALLDQFCIVPRNDQMNSPFPGELEHGAVSYHYDGYQWWRDAPGTPGIVQQPLAQFSRYSSREGDFYWTENRTRIHLARSLRRDVLHVQLESCMRAIQGYQHAASGLALASSAYRRLEAGAGDGGRLQVRLDEGAWHDSPSAFEWRLLPGGNHLAARSVNAFGAVGPMSSVTVELV